MGHSIHFDEAKYVCVFLEMILNIIYERVNKTALYTLNWVQMVRLALFFCLTKVYTMNVHLINLNNQAVWLVF